MKKKKKEEKKKENIIHKYFYSKKDSRLCDAATAFKLHPQCCVKS